MINRVGHGAWDDRRHLWLALLTSLSVSAFLLLNYYCISVDGVRYVATAKNFYSGDFKAALSSVYPPGYPVVIALFYNVFQDWERAGQMVSLVSSVLLLLPLHDLLRSMYGKSVAAVGCCLAAVSPFLAAYSVHVRTESLYFFLTVLALYFFHRGMERQKSTDFFFGGLISGFAYLVRPEAVGIVILVPAVLFFLWWMKGAWDLPSIARSSFALLLGFVLFAAPYVVYLSIDTGRWGSVSRKAGITLGVSLRDAGLVDTDVAKEFLLQETLSVTDFIMRQPWVYTKKVLGDILPSVGVYFEALHYSYLPFLLLGFLGVFRERPWERKDFLLLAYLIFFILGFAAILVNRRYSVQLVPISMGWAAVGVLWSWNWARRRWSATTARAAFVALGVIFLAGTLPKTLKPVAKEKAHLKEAGRYIRERHGAGNLRIMLFDDRIAFYAGAEAILMGSFSTELDDLTAHLRRRSFDFLVAEPKALQKRYPELLQSPENYGLRFDKEFVGSRRDRLLVYKLT